jgi:hypothetical protein
MTKQTIELAKAALIEKRASLIVEMSKVDQAYKELDRHPDEVAEVAEKIKQQSECCPVVSRGIRSW